MGGGGGVGGGGVLAYFGLKNLHLKIDKTCWSLYYFITSQQ